MWQYIEGLKDQLATIVALITALIALYKWVGQPLKKLLDRDKQQNDDLAILTWAFLQQAHDRYMRQGWCSTAEKEQITAMHKSYVAKGRNHLSETYEADILALPEHPPAKR